MSFTHWLPLALLLCNYYFNSATAQVQPDVALSPNASSNDEKSPEQRSKDIINNIFKRKFVDLNIDVLIMIFKQLDLPDLINMSQTNWESHTIAEAVFRQKFRDYEVRIVNAEARRLPGENLRANDVDKYIEIFDSESLEELFKVTGKWYQNLMISNYQLGERSKAVNEIVNEYTSNWLIRLDLKYVLEDTFESLQLPFVDVEVLSFMVDRKISTQNVLKLNKLFPKLRRLHIQMGTRSDIGDSFLNCTFEYLEAVTAHICYSDSEEQKRQIESLLQKNPQIKSLILENFPDDYAIEVSKLLPSLQDLTLHSLGDIADPLHFANLTKLKLFATNLRAIEKFDLPSIQSLEMNYRNSFEELHTFLRNHQNLIDLHLHIFGKPTHVQLKELTAELPNLESLQLSYDSKGDYPSVDSITKIIQNVDRLVHIEFPVDEMKLLFDKSKRAELKKFRKQHGNEWQIRVVKSKLILDRKILSDDLS